MAASAAAPAAPLAARPRSRRSRLRPARAAFGWRRRAEEQPEPAQGEEPPAQPLHTLSARAWRRDALHPGFPEDALPELWGRSRVGVAFSGGGSRGYVAALAQLGALQSLGLLRHARCVTAVSGGGWAAAVYTFYRPGGDGPRDDGELFGASYDAAPEAQSWEALAELPARCARGAVVRASLIDAVVRSLQRGLSPSAAWAEALHNVVFAPVGVPLDAPWGWSREAAEAAVARNPDLLPPPQDWVLPARADAAGAPLPPRPFLVLGITVLGPVQLVPHRPLKLRAYTLLEASGMYAGVGVTRSVRYTSSLPGARLRRARHTTGGYVEPFAIDEQPAAGTPAPQPLPPGVAAGLLRLPRAVHGVGLSLARAAAASSFAPGGLLASQLPGRRLASRLGWPAAYFSPAAPAAEAAAGPTQMLLADGGCLSNPAIHPLLQRGLSRLVLFLNFQTPLAPRAAWDPTQRPPTSADCSEELPALFGCVIDTSAWSFIHNAVFPAEDLPRLACALQEAAASGGGAVVTMEHVTVANAWWGIAGGRRVTVTWCYLAAAPDWAARLPPQTAARLGGGGGAAAAAAAPGDPAIGPQFPHYGTLDLALGNRQVNLLHSLCDWTVRRHAAQFQATMAPRPEAAAAAAPQRPQPAAEEAGALTRSARMLLRSGGGATRRVMEAGNMAARVLAGLLLSMMPRREGVGEELGAETPDAAAAAAVAEAQPPPPPPPPPPAREQPAEQPGRTAAARRALQAALSSIRGALPSG